MPCSIKTRCMPPAQGESTIGLRRKLFICPPPPGSSRSSSPCMDKILEILRFSRGLGFGVRGQDPGILGFSRGLGFGVRGQDPGILGFSRGLGFGVRGQDPGILGFEVWVSGFGALKCGPQQSYPVIDCGSLNALRKCGIRTSCSAHVITRTTGT
jgi:hypothetical protein